MCKRNAAGILKTIRGILVCQFQEGQAAFISLFFHPIEGKEFIDHRSCRRTNTGSPTFKTVTVPFAVKLMVLRHVVRIGSILAHPAMQASVAAYAVPLIVDFDKALCAADIHLLSGVDKRDRVICLSNDT